MANSTDSVEDQEDLNSEEEVDETKSQDESSDEDQSSDNEDNQEETGNEGDDESAFTQRLTQFKGDGAEEYAKNLETGYLQTSKEGVRLARENKDLKAYRDRVDALVATNPELAKVLQGQPAAPNAPATTPPTTTVDPAIAYMNTKMQQEFKAEFDDFVEQHPEVETDPVLAEQLEQKVAVVRDAMWANEKRMPGMGEALRIGWFMLGKDDSGEKLRAAARDNASSTKSASGATKGAPKSKFSEEQIEYFVESKGISRSEAIKKLSEYASA